MASSRYEALSAEIDRITASPYPSQLHTLRDIVVSQCSDADIAQWVAAKPCLVDALTSCLLEGLQQWSYVLDIITKFAFNTPCRDAFLRQEPTLLHSVVSRAVQTGDKNKKYTEAAIALLSLPLPDTVALPADVQTLLIHLVEEAAKRPSATTIEPVYLILIGTGSLVLGVLSTDVLVRLEKHLLNILKDGSMTDDQPLCLYCLSIMNVICSCMDTEFRLTASSYNTQDFLASTPTSSRWKSDAIQQFFTGSKAQKSVHLIVLLVLWAAATRGTQGDATGERIKSLALANEVIITIPADLRKNWCTANTLTICKLQEKLCAEDLEHSVKTLALRFIGKLCQLDSLPHAILEKIEMTFLEPRSMQTSHTLCPRMDDRDLFSSVLVRAPISILLQNAVEYAIRADSIELASGLGAVTSTVRAALGIAGQHRITDHEVRATLSEAAFTQRLHRLRHMLSQEPSQEPGSGTSGWCRRALHRRRSNLAHQISDMLLRAAQSSQVGPDSMSLLLNLHALSARGDLHCSHDKPSWRDHLDISEAADMSSIDNIDWREAVHTHFKARAQVEQNAVTRMFSKACASLEARCENVEKPLRKEQERRLAAEEYNEDLTRAFAELESRNVEYIVQMRTLEDDRDRYVQELEESRNENSELMDRVGRLEQKLRNAHVEGKKQLEEFNNAKQLLEMDSATTAAKKEEVLEDLQEQLEQSMRNAAVQHQKLSTLQNDLATARLECERFKHNISSGNSRVGELERTVDDLQRNIQELKTQESRMHAKLDSANNNMSSVSQQVSELTQQLQKAHSEREELKHTLSREAEELQASLDQKQEETEVISKQYHEARDDLQRQISELREEMEETQDVLTSDVEARDAKIVNLKKRVDRLQRKCEQKDQQISEAESMRSNLMAAMGISNPQGRSLPHRPRDSMAQQTQTQADPTPSTPISESAMDMEQPHVHQSFESNDSQESKSGPTPKRHRPGKAFMAPATSFKTRASTGGKALKKSTQTLQAARRQTLGAVSTNRTSCKPVPFKTLTKEVFGEIGDDESIFEGSELFTGTQGAHMVDVGAAFDES